MTAARWYGREVLNWVRMGSAQTCAPIEPADAPEMTRSVRPPCAQKSVWDVIQSSVVCTFFAPTCTTGSPFRSL
jgi:hypothetical protein